MALRAHEHGIKERRNRENHMLETMQKNSVAQSRQFEEAVVTQRNQLEDVAQREAESSPTVAKLASSVRRSKYPTTPPSARTGEHAQRSRK